MLHPFLVMFFSGSVLETGMLGSRLGGHGELDWRWLCLAPRSSPAPPALHTAQLLIQVELCLKLLHSFTYLL